MDDSFHFHKFVQIHDNLCNCVQCFTFSDFYDPYSARQSGISTCNQYKKNPPYIKSKFQKLGKTACLEPIKILACIRVQNAEATCGGNCSFPCCECESEKEQRIINKLIPFLYLS